MAPSSATRFRHLQAKTAVRISLWLKKRWGELGLLQLSRVQEDRERNTVRIFNAYKSAEADRQIGDRRIPNAAERHLPGRSQYLPQGQALVSLHLRRFKDKALAYVSGRKDFYHQLQVTPERAASNLLPFDFPGRLFANSNAAAAFDIGVLSGPREIAGDGLAASYCPPPLGRQSPKQRGGLLVDERPHPCLQVLCCRGITLGVEFALEAHRQLLCSFWRNDHPRVLSCRAPPLPLSATWQALV